MTSPTDGYSNYATVKMPRNRKKNVRGKISGSLPALISAQASK